jgi:hypothetical protein
VTNANTNIPYLTSLHSIQTFIIGLNNSQTQKRRYGEYYESKTVHRLVTEQENMRMTNRYMMNQIRYDL